MKYFPGPGFEMTELSRGGVAPIYLEVLAQICLYSTSTIPRHDNLRKAHKRVAAGRRVEVQDAFNGALGVRKVRAHARRDGGREGGVGRLVTDDDGARRGVCATKHNARCSAPGPRRA